MNSLFAQKSESLDFSLNNQSKNGIPSHIILESKVEINEFQNWLKENFNITSNSTFQKTDSNIDIVGNKHLKLKQYYKGLPVEGTAVNLHCKGNVPYSFNGFFVPDLQLEIDVRISESIALENAMQYFPKGSVFAWQDNTDSLLTEQGFTKTQSMLQYPEAELVIAMDPVNSNQYKLAYKFKICSVFPFDFKEVFVDATGGTIISARALINYFDKSAIAYTKYSGMQNIVCDSIDTNLFTLLERGRGLDSIIVMNSENPPTYLFYDTDTIWNNFNAQKDEVAGDVMWGIEKTYDYFKEKFGRNSFDNKGHSISGYVHKGTNNASWMNGGGGIANFGNGDNVNYNPWTSIDIVAHEITHGITQSTANLLYERESGALSESFSDIFAKCVEKYAIPDSFSWILGKPILINPHIPVRVLDNPHAVNHPKYYFGKYFDLKDSDDFYGIHKNCGVQNYWFYLLCEGGIGFREADSKPYSVAKIGIDTAAIIAYYTLTNYLTEYSGFNDAATYSIAATKLIFGDSSPLVKEVTNAWYAVGVLNTTDIKELPDCSSLGPNIYPNPANEVLNIQGLEMGSNIELYDVMGRLVLQQQCNSTISKLDVGYLTKGFYTLKVTTREGKVSFTKNFIFFIY